MTSVSARQIVTSHGMLDNAWLRIDNGHIVEIRTDDAPADATQVAGTLIPGFVDIHCHGGGGYSFDDAHNASKAADFHLAHGTTSLVASLVSASIDEQVRLLQELEPLVDLGVIAGVHLEGPFLSQKCCGAQNPVVLVDPTNDYVQALLDASSDALSMITIAPELPYAFDAIRTFVSHGVTVAIGHSDCSAEVAREAVDNGATVVTHLFNAMRKMHHREHGLAEYALVDERLSTEVIADGVHVGDIALRLAAAMKTDRLIAVTDAISAAGMPDGTVTLGGLEVTCAGGVARLTGTDTLAGSMLTMDRAFAHLLTDVGLEVTAAVHATSTEPARVLGLHDVGSIEVGKRANLIAWDRGVTAVFKQGHRVN